MRGIADRRLLGRVAAAWLIAYVAVMLTTPFPSRLMQLIAALVPLLTAAALAGVAWRAAARSRGAVRVGWACIGGVGAGFVAGIVVVGVVASLIRSPAVSLALLNITFLSGVPLGLAGVVALSPRPGSLSAWLRGGVDLLMAAGMLVFLAWVFLVEPALAQGQPDRWALLNALAYPVGYALVAALALRTVAQPGANRRAVGLLAAGLTAQAAAMVWVFQLLQQDQYASGHPVEAVAVAGMLLMALAALQPDAFHPPGTARSAGALTQLAPMAPLLVAAPIALSRAEDLTEGAAPAVVAVLLALTARQSLSLAEQRGLAQRFRRLAQRQATLTEHVSDAVILVAPDGRIPFASPSLERFFGIPADDVSVEALGGLIDADDRQRLTGVFADVLATGAAHSTRLEVRTPDGWRQVEVDLAAVDDEEFGSGVLVTFRDVTEQVEAERSLQRASTLDPVTSLPNRAVFIERLEQAMGRRADTGELVVLVADLDHFSTVNDSLGHRVGDSLLALAARRLTAALPDCLVARLGGDEFGILATGASSTAAQELAAIVVRSFRDPFDLASVDIALHCSVGVARGHDAIDADQLLQAADTALYAAKAEGRDRFAVYTDLMGAAVHERLALTTALPRALDRLELELWYQPLFDVRSQDLVSFEALLRWRSPEHGLVPPARFIPIAEESELIVRIGRWALREACGQLAAWRTSHVGAADVTVAVNLSARELTDLALPSSIAQVLSDCALPPEALTVEVTESLSLSDAALPALHALRDVGVRIAMDDFGTGHSSLAALQRLPCDVLKLDRSFLTSVADRSDAGARFLRSVVDMAHSLELRTVAEGVETPVDLRLLERARVDIAQGYLLGRPAPAEQARALLSSPARMED